MASKQILIPNGGGMDGTTQEDVEEALNEEFGIHNYEILDIDVKRERE